MRLFCNCSEYDNEALKMAVNSLHFTIRELEEDNKKLKDQISSIGEQHGILYDKLLNYGMVMNDGTMPEIAQEFINRKIIKEFQITEHYTCKCPQCIQ